MDWLCQVRQGLLKIFKKESSLFIWNYLPKCYRYISDYQDAMKDIRDTEQYQTQTDLQREKEVNRMNNESAKNQIEREKIQAQKEIADKQLQIARENKNKYDVRNQNDAT